MGVTVKVGNGTVSYTHLFQGEKEANPEFSGKEYILERQLKTEARKDIIEKLAKAGIKPTAMMRCV